MEFLKTIAKRRSLVSELVYIIFNIGLAVLLMLVVRYTNSLVPAFILVVLSKWRVFAVRARFWLANIQANAVCFIVSVSYVIFLSAINPSVSGSDETVSLILQLILASLYIAWLVLLKPQSKRHFMVMQSGVSLFVGLTAIFMVSYGWIASPVVFLVWLVSFVSIRHTLSAYDEDHNVLLSLAFSLLLVEIGWLAHHWVIAYRLPFSEHIAIPQVSIVSILIGFIFYKAYDSFYHHQKIRSGDIILPLIFAISLGLVLVVFGNNINQIIG